MQYINGSIHQDRNGLWHDKPSINGDPTSNNWMIYTAFSKLLGFIKDDNERYLMHEYFRRCAVTVLRGEIVINRHPNKLAPPMSRDEIIGAYILGLIEYKVLKANHFVYEGIGKPLGVNLIDDVFVGLMKLGYYSWVAGEVHRNNFWKYKIEELYQVAFRLTPADIYWIKKCERVKPHIEEKIAFNLYYKTILKSGSYGEKNLLWAQLITMGDRRHINLDLRQNMLHYFGAGHDFYLRARSLRS